jgi:uncharacterized protein YlxW (UPF0749 family)
MKWEDVFFVVQWMAENINTECVDSEDKYQLEKITDDCHIALMKHSNKKKIAKLAQRIKGYEDTISDVSNGKAYTKPGSLSGRK